MKIKDIVEVYQGITLSRIKRNENSNLQEFLVYSFFEGEGKYIKIPNDHEMDIPFTKKDMVLLNITSYRASIVEADEEGRVIPSTFIILLAKDNISPAYLEWYFNESREFHKSLHIIKQGSVISSIPIHLFKDITINIPSMKVQNKIAHMSRLMKKSKELFEEREELLKDILKYMNQEGINNDKSRKA